MEALRIEEIELIGEDGGRIVVSADLWTTDPEKAGIALNAVMVASSCGSATRRRISCAR